MDEKYLDEAVQAASGAAAKAGEYKSETFLAVLLASLLRGTASAPGGRAAESVPVQESAQPPRAKRFSPGEFFAAQNWSTEVDKVLLAGYFLERHSSLESYSIQEVRNCLISAKVTPPKNVNLAIFQAVQRGWMMEVPREKDTGKAWVLTQSGEKRVEAMAKTNGQ